MDLDGPLGHEQSLGDLPVGLPLLGELRDSQLAGSEGVPTAQRLAPWPPAGDHQLLVGLFGQGQATLLVGEVESGPKRWSCLGPGPPMAKSNAETDEGAGQLQTGGRGFEHSDGFGQQVDTSRAPFDIAGRPQGDTDRHVCAPASCRLEFLGAELSGLTLASGGGDG